MDKNEPRMGFVFRGYNPKKWSLIKLFRTKEDEDQDRSPAWQRTSPYIYIKCNGLISNLDYCGKCKIRFQCLTSREPIIVNEKLFTRMWNDNYTPIVILRNYLFNKRKRKQTRNKKTGRFCK